MTVATTIAREVYSTDGAVTEFDFHFKLLEEADLEVYYRGPDGTEDTLLTLSTDYTISSGPWPTGGTVTMVAATASGGTLTLRRNRAYTQETVFPEGGKFPASSVEETLDALTMLAQQLLDDQSRTVKLPVSDEGDYKFPIPTERANKALIFGDDGDIEVSDLQQFRSGNGVPASSLGNDRDHYLDNDNGDIYLKASGAWSVVDNIGGQAAAAETAETNAETAATNAATSATNAATSETNAGNSAIAAATSETNAGNSATAAAISETNAETALETFNAAFYGAAASDPTEDPNGDAVAEGGWYFNTTTNRARIYDGSSWITIGAGPVLATAQASTSGTSIDFTSIPSWATKIDLMFAGVSLDGANNIDVHIGDAGGLETTGYLCRGVHIASSYDTTFGFRIPLSGAASLLSGHMTLILLDALTNTWACNGIFGSSSGTSQNTWMAGSKSLSGILDRLSITVPGSDPFDAGLVNIRYE